MSAPLPPGTILGGRYRLASLLGRGGFGAVYEGVQEGLGRRVAVKVLLPELVEDPELVARFRREAQAAAALGHASIVQVTDFVSAPGEPPAIVMELLQGQSFARAIETQGALAERRVAFIASQVLSALEAAHAAGIVHRDIKPDNVFLTTIAGVDDVVKVLDFGIAKLLSADSPSVTTTGVVMGTPQFMAPEQARGKAVDARADVYAVGTCMYQALTGRLPFADASFNALLFAIAEDAPPSLASLRPGLDPRLCEIVARAMAKRPDERFQSAADMRAALAPFLDRPIAVVTPAGVTARSIVPTAATVRSEIPAPEHARPAEPSRAPSRAPLVLAAAALAVLLGLAGGAYAVIYARSDQTKEAPDVHAVPSASATTAPIASARTTAATPAPSASTSASTSEIASASTSAPPPPPTTTTNVPTTATTSKPAATTTRAATASATPARAPMAGRSASLTGMSTNDVYPIDTVRSAYAAIAADVNACYAATEFDPPDHQFEDYSFTVDAGGAITNVGVVGTSERCVALDACMNQAIRKLSLGVPAKPGTLNVFFTARLKSNP